MTTSKLEIYNIVFVNQMVFGQRVSANNLKAKNEDISEKFRD
jgi:hypothetical protein